LLEPVTLEVEHALPARSPIDADGVQTGLVLPVLVFATPELVPKTIVTVEPLSDMFEPLNTTELPSVKVPLSSTLPIVAPLTVSRSFEELLAIETVTDLVPLPFQPPHDGFALNRFHAST
jgi:hypothetical protein